MNSKYELWIKWSKDDWKHQLSHDDLAKLRELAKSMKESLPIEVKIFAVERFEQPL